MSLDRFSNKEEILETTGITRGVVWNADEVDSLVLDVKTVTPDSTPKIEMHVYSPTGDYITSSNPTNFLIRDSKMYINYASELNALGLRRGLFEVAVNVHNDIVGSNDNRLLQIKEISPDRREMLVRLVPLPDEVRDKYSGLVNDYLTEYANPYAADLAVNFGNNNIVKIINQKDWDNEEDMVIRLYSALPDSVQLNNVFWIVEELADPYFDNIDLSIPLPTPQTTTLRGPNFDVSSNYNTITETEFKNWNDLLDANLSTSQRVIDRYFSGSLSGVTLGIDYTAFDNFVFYSSAAERIANFKYKMEMLEFYNNRLVVLNGVSGSDSGSLTNNVAITQQRVDNIIGTFDGFERWLYYEPTASLTTHGVSGSFIGSDGYAITPWPKYLSASQYYVHHTTSSLGTNWFNGFYATASAYDVENANALVKTIPEHIRTDVNNDQYELFVNMIGHHFDILYTYVEALTKTYRPEEQPKLGASRESIYEIAKSMGWTLANGNQASSLWKYKLGTNASGSYQSTGSLFSKTDEDITTEVWRRIVNNLPYLLKTKGTERSVKALMSCYGIPQTLLSIREYGGPKVEENVPTLIEDRYSYVLDTNNDKITSLAIKSFGSYSSSIGQWGIQRGGARNSYAIAPMAREWRFSPQVTESMVLAATRVATTRLQSLIVLEYTGSYSGSDKYGRILYAHSDADNTPANAVTFYDSTEWLPLYDGDMWNIRWWWETTGEHYNTGSNIDTTYYIQVQKASDFINGKIIHSSSLSVMPDSNTNQYTSWAGGGSACEIDLCNRVVPDTYHLASDLNTNYPSLNLNLANKPKFRGYLQEYREWLEPLTQAAFDEHTLNPTSYVSGLSPTSSYDTLIRHYPFGSDTIAINHNLFSSITSSHPANTIKNFTGATIGNTYSTIAAGVPADLELGHYTPIEETYYVQGVSLGGSLPRSEKIRLEDNYLIRRLSPTNTAERSSFDYAPIDTNRVGLFYSHADQVNKDIFNQIGDVALDDFVGDPNHEFEYQYPDLFHFSKNYWKKYTDRNDVNAYIRIFSQFDFSLFNQIKQLLPARVDEAMGLLIEPHALERVKVPLTKRPQVENPQYDVEFTRPITSASAEYMMYNASVAVTENVIDVESLYHYGTYNGYDETGDTWFANTYVGATSGAMDYCIIEINPVDALPSATASISDVFSKNTQPYDPWNVTGASTLKEAITSNDSDNKYAYFLFNSLVVIPQTSDDLYIVFDVLSQFDTNDSFDIDIWQRRLGGTDYSLSLTTEIQLLDSNNTIISIIESINSNVTLTSTSSRTRITFTNIHVPAYVSKLAVKLVFSCIDPTTQLGPIIEKVSIIRNIKEVCHSPLMPIIESYRPSNIYQQVVYHYSGSGTNLSLRDRNAQHAYSQSLGLYYSQSLIPATYMDDQFDQYENARYNGCRISSPDINIASKIAAIGNTPVIEVYETNPNQLIFTQNPESRGNTGNTEAGNLLVR
jgi:hypothetical protein